MARKIVHVTAHIRRAPRQAKEGTKVCPVCNGRGTVKPEHWDINVNMLTGEKRCGNCNGIGRVPR